MVNLAQGEEYPTFIYEIAHSESEEGLHESADEYFDKLSDSTGAILAFKLSYNRKRDPDFAYSATVSFFGAWEHEDSLWQKRIINNETFWESGQPPRPRRFVIPFELLIPFEERKKLPSEMRSDGLGSGDAAVASEDVVGLEFDFSELAEMAATAAERQRVRLEKPNIGTRKRSRVVKRTDETGQLIEDFSKKRKRSNSTSAAVQLTTRRTRSQSRAEAS